MTAPLTFRAWLLWLGILTLTVGTLLLAGLVLGPAPVSWPW